MLWCNVNSTGALFILYFTTAIHGPTVRMYVFMCKYLCVILVYFLISVIIFKLIFSEFLKFWCLLLTAS